VLKFGILIFLISSNGCFSFYFAKMKSRKWSK
jgi:hypothetical protein